MKKILLAIVMLGSLSSYAHANEKAFQLKCQAYHEGEVIGELKDMFESIEAELMTLNFRSDSDSIMFEALQVSDQSLVLKIYDKTNPSTGRSFITTTIDELAPLEFEVPNKGTYKLVCEKV